ncbi:MAG: DNA-directed RNA polymerase subunit D [Candidatus Woesearchaeota archaeon]
MEIKKLNQNENELVLEINDITTSEINSLRRIMIAETPTLTIEDIEFIENSSALYEEILANRLGLIPLITDLKSYNIKENCKCKGKGCVICQATVKLDKKGPCTVYASDLVFEDPKIKAVDPKTPITILTEGQKLKFLATAELGIGKDHMKFSPGIIYHINKPIIKINNNSSKFSEFKDKYPKEAFKDGKLNEEKIINNNLQGVCEGICDDIIKVEYDDNKFILHIESFGQLKPKEILTKALEVFNEKLDEFSKKLKDSKPNNIQKIASKIKVPKKK